MSNFLGIATVTATISNLLEEVQSDVLGTKITSKPLDVINSEPAANRLNLFLYQISYNPAYKNDSLPTRNHNGDLIANPSVALDLHYLITAYGLDNDDLLAQQILGSAIRIINENPILTKDIINDTIKTEEKIKFSDLANQAGSIKMNPEMMSIEELSKMWSSFFQTNYRLSAAYRATVVLLDSKKQPKPTLPVKERLLYVAPIKQPIINKVEPQILEKRPGAKIDLMGKNLKASDDGTLIYFDAISERPTKGNVSNNKITVSIPNELTAGVKKIQVVHPLLLGKKPTEHIRGYESNTAAFVLSPRIISMTPEKIVRGENLVLNFGPPVSPNQNVSILIGDRTFIVDQHVGQSSPVDNISVKIPDDFPLGNFLIRLRVDGAESHLVVDDDSNSPNYMKFLGPQIEVKKD